MSCIKEALAAGETYSYELSFEFSETKPVRFTSTVAAFENTNYNVQQPDDIYSNNIVEDRLTAVEGSGGGGGGGGLHAEQHYVYHKPLKAGDVLTATTKPGNSWEKEGRRGGKLMFSESVTEYRDESGDLVVTATSVGVRTERPATTS